MTIVEEATNCSSFGQIIRRVTWTEEEFEFVRTRYPREGFDELSFLERIVENFNPSGRELVYGWTRLMKHVKDNSFKTRNILEYCWSASTQSPDSSSG